MDIKRTRMNDQQKAECFLLRSQGYGSRAIAERVLGRSSRKSTVNDLFAREAQEIHNTTPKILFLDVESQGTVALTHGRYKTNISPKAVISEPHLLSYAYNWLHEPEDAVESIGLHHLPSWGIDKRNDILLVEQLWELLDEADVVVCHNAAFDTKIINARFAYHNIEPPSDYRTVCTLQGLRKYMRLPSNSLDSATRYFGLEQKLSNEGIGLWLRCYLGDEEAMQEMCEYGCGDIPTLRQLYFKIRPFLKNHPNIALLSDRENVECRVCASETPLEEIEGKHSYTNMSKFQSYRCVDCGAVQRSRTNKLSKEKLKGVKV